MVLRGEGSCLFLDVYDVLVGVLRLHLERSGLAGLPQYASYLLVRAQGLVALSQRHPRGGAQDGTSRQVEGSLLDLLRTLAQKHLAEALTIYSTTLGPQHRQTKAVAHYINTLSI